MLVGGNSSNSSRQMSGCIDLTSEDEDDDDNVSGRSFPAVIDLTNEPPQRVVVEATVVQPVVLVPRVVLVAAEPIAPRPEANRSRSPVVTRSSARLAAQNRAAQAGPSHREADVVVEEIPEGNATISRHQHVLPQQYGWRRAAFNLDRVRTFATLGEQQEETARRGQTVAEMLALKPPATKKTKVAVEKPQEQHNLSGCPICLDSLAELKANGHRLMSTMCGHVYCQVCLDQLLKEEAQPSCPKCRKKITKRTTHPIYL